MIEIEDLTLGGTSYDRALCWFDAVMVKTNSGTSLFLLRPVEAAYQLGANFTELREKMDGSFMVVEIGGVETKVHFLKEEATLRDLLYTAQLARIEEVKTIECLLDYNFKLEITKN